MAFSFSWPFRRRGSGDGGASKSVAAAQEDEELGVTPQLLDFLRTLSSDAFKSAALQLQGNRPLHHPLRDSTAPLDPDNGASMLQINFSNELAKIRYDLCPRHMKDKQFWRIYFLLAKSYISPYELRAIQKEKLRRMETESGKSKEVITVEVELQESKSTRVSQTSEVDLESQAS
ncbi:hypothetical protein PR202_ga18711 [Eleusine coracana subsp. coracana]|uniref:BSD domain-containing protein n=1 Tax=Eleusine coracana subsp. coracana TaxID=191504 RepID=A0AAV5CTP2_ELECO|nr:hypothetical protein PR202_ga18711 [Eleusine coracana subsp. coracana]